MKVARPRLGLAALMLITYGYFCGGYVNNVCTNAVADLTIAMVDHHTFHIDAYAGNSNDISERDGHFFSGFGPGLSFMLVPVYVAIKPVLGLIPAHVLQTAGAKLSAGIYAKTGHLRSTNSRMTVLLLIVAGTALVSIPLGMLTTWYVVLTSRCLVPRLSGHDATLVAFVTAFGTIILVYSVNLIHTGVAAFLMWIVVARSMRARSPTTPATIWNGFLLGLAPAIDYPAASYVACAGVFVLLLAQPSERAKAAVRLAAGAATPGLALLAYHWSAFGSPFTNAYRFRVRTVDQSVFDVTNLDSSLPNAQKLYVAFLNPNSGLLLYFPLLLLAIGVVGYLLYTERDHFRKLFWGLTGAIITINLAIYCSFPLALGPGNAPGFGVRYMMYSAPFVMVAFAALLARLPADGHPAARRALLGLAFINAVPSWAYACYGSPAFPARDYWRLLMEVGPGTYTWTKLHDARLLTTPVWAWLGAAAISVLIFFWARLVRRLLVNGSLREKPSSTPMMVEAAESD